MPRPKHADVAPPDDRPQLRRIAADLEEGVVVLGLDGAIVWANAAALAMHAVEAIAELGGDASGYHDRFRLRYRNGAATPKADYPIARLVAGEAFVDLLFEVARADRPDDDHILKARGFKLTDVAGEADCLVIVLDDVTETLEAEDRFERMFNANPAPAAIIRAADLRYLRVNAGLLQLMGRHEGELVGRSLYEVDILADAEHRDLAKARLAEWRAIPQMEAELPLPDGGTRLVILAGHPVEMSEERCMIFTFADLEPRRRAEMALRQSEERFAKSFRLMPAPMKLSTLDGHRILNANDAFLQITGWTYEEVIGRRPADIELWDSAQTRREVERRLAETGAFRSYELRLKAKDGSLIPCLASAETVTINSELCVLSVFQDISERKRTEGELITAIEAAMQDTTWLSRNIMDKLAALRAPDDAQASAGRRSADLTAREREVIELIARGRSDAAIAEALSLSRNTVRNHVARLYAKIGAHSRSEAIVWARDRGHAAPKAAKT